MDSTGRQITEGHPGNGAISSGGVYAVPAGRMPELCGGEDPGGSSFDRLAHAVAQDVVPLLNLPATAPRRLQRAARPIVTPSTILRFAALAIESDLAGAFAVTDLLRDRGVSVETIFHDLLAPAARHLGTLWEDDDCSFTQVTIGVGALHHVLRTLAPSMPGRVAPGLAGRTALLVPAPGDQHSLGLAMGREFFSSGGWIVEGGTPGLADLAPRVRGTWFGIVGFSLGSEVRLDRLRSAIRIVRDASRNRDVGILVGGLIFLEHPELVAEVGADATAPDGRQAIRHAERMLRAVTVCA